MIDAVVADPWRARLDRMRRLLPLPLLVVSTAGYLAAPGEAHVGVPIDAVVLVGGAAVWSLAVTARLRSDTSFGWRRAAFTIHIGLAAALVWVDPWFGVYAYTGFLLAHSLGPSWRQAGFAATALVVAAALAGGYPSGLSGQTATYVLVAGVILTLVLNSASITNRALDQNDERGRMIAELAEAKRRLEASMEENAELHARLVAQARESGIVDERQRLAGEIHDTLAQGLTGIIAQLGAAEHARADPSRLTRHLELARSLARSNLADARRSVQALRPEQLEGATLPDAVAALVEAWSQESRIDAELRAIGSHLTLGVDRDAALYRAAQEALANVAKHAAPSHVRLTLTYLDDVVLLDVADDGGGFDPAAPTGGYGLVGMRQRLARVGGTLTVESTPGYGTTLNATVPLGVVPEGDAP